MLLSTDNPFHTCITWLPKTTQVSFRPTTTIERLRQTHTIIRPPQPPQLLVRPLFHDLAVLEDKDAIGMPDGAQPVRDGHGGATGRGIIERLLHLPLARSVERAGRFVEEQDLRFPDERPGQRDALPLTA